MLIDTSLIQMAVAGAMRQAPRNKAPKWSQSDLEKVAELLPYYSPREIGTFLGRSEDAIKIIRQRNGIPPSTKSPGWITANQVRQKLGMTDARPVIGWIKKGFVCGHKISGVGAWLLHETSLRRWIASPQSWVYFDPSNITDTELARLVELSQSRWNDEWLTTRQVADMKRTDTRVVLMAIKRGHLAGVQVQEKDGRHSGAAWALWAVKRSDAEEWEYMKPAFDLMDNLHAFMLLARAIGLSNDRIGKLCNLSDETVNKRMRKIDKMRYAPRLIKKHNRLRLVSTGVPAVGVHADWRKHSDQFPHVRRAFERFNSGKASMDDCYLITRILKVQIAASGVKCNISALGKCSPETITSLIRKMRQLGIAPYLPKRKK